MPPSRPRLWSLSLAPVCAAAAVAAGAALVLGAETSVATAVAAIGLPAALAVAVAALRRSARMQREADKLSADLDVLSQRLVRLEMRAASPEASSGAGPISGNDRLEELTAEMGLWGEIVRDLAVAVGDA
jgi:cyclic-di-GMP phosphodiesterase TipF (flagellum assembly factor)